jgi:flagellar biosynthesis/type III secretory pathway M-ring protein FliF/YscJ
MTRKRVDEVKRREMSTIAVIAIVVGAVILLALIATRIFAKPRIDEQRRGKARHLRARAEARQARAEHARAGATEQRARAHREEIEADERSRAADEELELASKEHRQAARVDPDR